MDFIGAPTPAFARLMEYAGFYGAGGAIECYPCHEFGMSEVATASTNFPDALIGLPPSPFKIVQQRLTYGPAASGRDKIALDGLEHGIGDLANYIELQLVCG